MNKLIQGERSISLGVLLGLIAVLAIGAALLLFIVSLYGTANSARDAEQNLRQIIQSRCEARVAYDNRFVSAAEGDAKFYNDLLTLSDKAAKIRPIPLTLPQQRIADAQRLMIQEARDRKRAIVAEGVIGNCGVFQTK